MPKSRSRAIVSIVRAVLLMLWLACGFVMLGGSGCAVPYGIVLSWVAIPIWVLQEAALRSPLPVNLLIIILLIVYYMLITGLGFARLRRIRYSIRILLHSVGAILGTLISGAHGAAHAEMEIGLFTGLLLALFLFLDRRLENRWGSVEQLKSTEDN